MNDSEIKFGPRPEKLWVGMKGKTNDGGEVVLKEINKDWLLWNGDWIFISDLYGFLESNRHVKVVEWEQPRVTCCDYEPETDWNAKYEQLMEQHEKLQAELKAQECAYNVVVERKNLLQRERDRLFRERNVALAERDNMRSKAEKLDKIEEVLSGDYEDDD